MAGYREPLEDAQFFRLSEPASYMPPENSHVVSRSTVRVIPQTGTEYTSTGNRVIRIVLPSTGFLDTQNSYFLFDFNNSTPKKDADFTGAVPGTVYATSSASEASDAMGSEAFCLGGVRTSTASLFQRVRILVGGSVIEDINAYNLIANMLFRCGRTTFDGSTNNQAITAFAEGYQSGKERALAKNYRGQFWQFMHKPMNGVLSNVRYLPLAYIGEMTVELTLEDPTILFHDTRVEALRSTTYKYDIRNFSYQCDILQFDPEYVRGFETSMLTRGINIPFETFTHYKSTTSSLGDLVINHRGRNVKNLWTFLRGQGQLAAADNSFVGKRCGLDSWQLRIGAFMKPLLPVRCSDTAQVESFIEFVKTLTGFNRIDNGDIDIEAGQWGNDKENSYFVIGVDLEREGQIASGLDTASEATPITLALTKYTTSTAPNSPIHLDTFVHSGANLIISSPHEVTLFT